MFNSFEGIYATNYVGRKRRAGAGGLHVIHPMVPTYSYGAQLQHARRVRVPSASADELPTNRNARSNRHLESRGAQGMTFSVLHTSKVRELEFSCLLLYYDLTALESVFGDASTRREPYGSGKSTAGQPALGLSACAACRIPRNLFLRS